MCGVLLVPWIGLLIEQLHGQASKRSFSSSWVGLYILEAVCLLIVAALLSRRHRATSPVAAAAAAILCMDAWFDTMSARPAAALRRVAGHGLLRRTAARRAARLDRLARAGVGRPARGPGSCL